MNTAFLRPLEASGIETGGKRTPMSWHIHADCAPSSTCITLEVSLSPCGPGSQLGAVAALPVTWLCGDAGAAHPGHRLVPTCG